MATAETVNKIPRVSTRQIEVNIQEVRVVRSKEKTCWTKRRRRIAVIVTAACVTGVVLALAILLPILLTQNKTATTTPATTSTTVTIATTTSTTSATTYIPLGSLPSAGSTTSGSVCYNWNSNNCYWSNTISITNCNTYYVYSLIAPPVCNLRYCTQ